LILSTCTALPRSGGGTVLRGGGGCGGGDGGGGDGGGEGGDGGEGGGLNVGPGGY